ncbi:hypothetical protein FXO37_00776 [Capsicum annuum]|nr:hypothetical protein FXO37_00776 [Capsicum annuum]
MKELILETYIDGAQIMPPQRYDALGIFSIPLEDSVNGTHHTYRELFKVTSGHSLFGIVNGKCVNDPRSMASDINSNSLLELEIATNQDIIEIALANLMVDSNKVKFLRSNAFEASFEKLKVKLTFALVFTLPKGIVGFVIYYDASRGRLSWVLMQRGKFVAYAFRQLKYVFTHKELNLRQRRWLELLKDYDISLHYHLGKDNVVADDLSMLSIRILFYVNEDKRRMTKYAHFLPVRTNYSMKDYAKLFILEIVKLHGEAILSDRGTKWIEVSETRLFGPAIVHQALEKVKVIRDRLKPAQSPQKSYADVRLRELMFDIGDWVLLKKVGNVVYELELPSNFGSINPVFHVSMLNKCVGDPSLFVPSMNIGVLDSLSYKDIPIKILDRQVCHLKTTDVASVNILRRNHQVKKVSHCGGAFDRGHLHGGYGGHITDRGDYQLNCGGEKVGWGGTLIDRVDGKDKNVMVFALRKLKLFEKNYPTHNLEWQQWCFTSRCGYITSMGRNVNEHQKPDDTSQGMPSPE